MYVHGSLITESKVIKCMSDEKYREILTLINSKEPILISKLGLTRKQYYSIWQDFVHCRLIRKYHQKFVLTQFGKFVFDWHLVLKNIISKDYWKLEAIDLLRSPGIPDPIRAEIVSTFLDGRTLNQLLPAL